MKKELGIFVLLVVLCIIVSIVNPNFLLPINLQNLARQIGAFGIFSIGLGLVIITGGIELSVGSIARINGFSREHTLATDEEIILYVPTKDAQKLTGAQAARQ